MRHPSTELFRSAVAWVSTDVLAALVARWDAGTVARAERWARDTLAELPLPAFPHADSELARRRTRLEILLGALDARRGDDRRLLEAARKEWVLGGSNVTYLRLLLALGREEHALRLGLTMIGEARNDAARIESMLTTLLGLPAGTDAQLRALAKAPDVDGWVTMTRFWSRTNRGPRTRFAIAKLLALGGAPSEVFRMAASEGAIDALEELADTGRVPSEVIVRYAEELARGERAAFLGLAARAAAVRGESFRAVRLLCAARAEGRDATALGSDLTLVRAHADELSHRALSSSGFDVGSREP